MKQVLLVVLARSHARTLARSLTPALTTEFLFRILPLGFSDASCTLQYCTVRRAIQAHPLPPLRLTRSRLLVLEPAAFFFLSFQRKEDIDTLLHIASSVCISTLVRVAKGDVMGCGVAWRVDGGGRREGEL
jgi:hypothetical protein